MCQQPADTALKLGISVEIETRVASHAVPFQHLALSCHDHRPPHHHAFQHDHAQALILAEQHQRKRVPHERQFHLVAHKPQRNDIRVFRNIHHRLPDKHQLQPAFAAVPVSPEGFHHLPAALALIDPPGINQVSGSPEFLRDLRQGNSRFIYPDACQDAFLSPDGREAFFSERLLFFRVPGNGFGRVKHFFIMTQIDRRFIMHRRDQHRVFKIIRQPGCCQIIQISHKEHNPVCPAFFPQHPDQFRTEGALFLNPFFFFLIRMGRIGKHPVRDPVKTFLVTFTLHRKAFYPHTGDHFLSRGIVVLPGDIVQRAGCVHRHVIPGSHPFRKLPAVQFSAAVDFQSVPLAYKGYLFPAACHAFPSPV